MGISGAQQVQGWSTVSTGLGISMAKGEASAPSAGPFSRECASRHRGQSSRWCGPFLSLTPHTQQSREGRCVWNSTSGFPVSTPLPPPQPSGGFLSLPSGVCCLQLQEGECQLCSQSGPSLQTLARPACALGLPPRPGTFSLILLFPGQLLGHSRRSSQMGCTVRGRALGRLQMTV